MLFAHTKKRKRSKSRRREEEEGGGGGGENYFLQRGPTWEHKAISGSDSILYARCSQSYGNPLETGAYHQRIKLAKEFNLERTDYVSDCQSDRFRSRPAHQWLSGDHDRKDVFSP